MTDIITTLSIGKGMVNTNPILLEQTPETALIFKPQVHQGGVRGWLVRYKKSKDEKWEELKEKDFRSLHLHEGVRIELGTKQIKILCEEIEKLRGIPVESGENKYVVRKEEEVLIISDRNVKEVVKQILSKGISNQFWKELKLINPKEATRLSLLRIQEERNLSLQEFRNSIDDGNKSENYWQDFFEVNKWIFGYGLNYKILRQEQTQSNYGGTRVDGTGGERGDCLTSTKGDIGFTVLVEIKTPFTPLLQGIKPQRNGAWSLSKELTDGLTQLQANKSTWEIKGSREEDNRDRLENENIFTVTPNGILVIGRLNKLETRDEKGTFHRFRQSVHGIEVITFDELLKRAEFIVKD